MLLGEMEVSESPELKKELWGPMDKIYYPKGVSDPDYCIFKFTAREGRYYRNLKTESYLL